MAQVKSKPKKVCGPGIEGFQDCPSMYHMDFNEEEFQALLANPTDALQAMGLQSDAPVVTIVNKAWSKKQDKWVALNSVTPDSSSTVSPQARWCCFYIGDVVSCGRWYYA